MLLHSPHCAARCIQFLLKENPDSEPATIQQLDFGPKGDSSTSTFVQPRVSAVIYPAALWPSAKAFWQHTGEGVSSRRAEFCQHVFDEGQLITSSAGRGSPPRVTKGPKRYQRVSADLKNLTLSNGSHPPPNGVNVSDSVQFVEERFGRNLDVTLTAQAKLAVRKRIAGNLTSTADLPDSLTQSHADDLARTHVRDVPGFSADDVYLYSGGMNAIFHAHETLKATVRSAKSVMYGFPYVDTLKVLQKFGPGAIFYGHGSGEDLDDLEHRLENGEKILSLFCEFPGNPLLRTPDIARIRRLADKYDFAVVIDETIGNLLNVHVLPYADILVSSLTKIFSGDSNVMGGSMILNPNSRFYRQMKSYLEEHYEDNLFAEDAIYLERNSRDFITRNARVNHNASTIAALLLSHPRVKQVNYPQHSPTRQFYDACRLPDGGYGGLLSATFHSIPDAQAFYDHLDVQKGPSLGTNFTLASPFVLLAHYKELDWAAEFGCEESLVRFSVGLEESESLRGVFQFALDAIPKT